MQFLCYRQMNTYLSNSIVLRVPPRTVVEQVWNDCAEVGEGNGHTKQQGQCWHQISLLYHCGFVLQQHRESRTRVYQAKNSHCQCSASHSVDYRTVALF